MADYNFWADVLDTFQSSPDWIKALWLMIPPGFLLALIRMAMRFRLEARRDDKAAIKGELIYSVHRGADGEMHILSHLSQWEPKPALLLLDEPSHDAHALQSYGTRL